MLIQGTPDILKPPSGPLSSLDGVSTTMGGESPDAAEYQRVFIETRGRDVFDQVQRIVNSGASDGEIWIQLQKLALPDLWRALGLEYTDFLWWTQKSTKLYQLQQIWNSGADSVSKANEILSRQLLTGLATDDEFREITGMSRQELSIWAINTASKGDPAAQQRYKGFFSIAFGLGLDIDQLAQLLTQFAAKEQIAAQDIANLSGRSLEEIRQLLAMANGVVTWRGFGLVVQPKPTKPGYVFSQCGDGSTWQWHYIPPGSARVADVSAGCATEGRIVLTTEDGVSAEVDDGPGGVRQLPIRDDTWGRLWRLRRDPSMDYMTKNRELLKAVTAMGVTDPAEIDEWVIEGAARVRAWDEVQQAQTPTFEEVGVQAVNFAQDAQLNAEFAAIDSDPNLTEVEKAQAFTEIAARENLGIEDVSRIVGVQTSIVREFMEQGGYGTDTYGEPVPVVVPVPEPVKVTIPGTIPTLSAGSIPANLPEMSAIEKAEAYNTLLELGNTDALIREVVEYQFGKQADADWAALQAMAASLRIPLSMPITTPVIREPVGIDLFPTPMPVVTPPDKPIYELVNLENKTPQERASIYNQLLARGMTDQAIRAAVEQIYGKQRDEDWAALQALAQSQRRAMIDEIPLPPAAGGGLGPLILAVAAAAILGG